MSSLSSCKARALGLTVALTLGAVSMVGAQSTTTTTTKTTTDSTVKTDSTRTHTRRTTRTMHRRMRTTRATSTTRIPVTKQVSAGGNVAPVIHDTVTLTQTRVDTVVVQQPAPPARVETVTVVQHDVAPAPIPPAPIITKRSVGNFYWGVGGGASMPQGDLKNGYGIGYNVTVPFGWDAPSSPLGLRFDVGYDREMGRSDVGIQNDIGVWSGNADAKLRMKIPGVNNGTRFYVVGGGGVARVVGYGSATPTYSNGSYAYPDSMSRSFSGAKTELSWNAGAGLSFPIARSQLFLESRYFDVNTTSPLGSRTRFVPLILGVIF